MPFIYGIFDYGTLVELFEDEQLAQEIVDASGQAGLRVRVLPVFRSASDYISSKFSADDVKAELKQKLRDKLKESRRR